VTQRTPTALALVGIVVMVTVLGISVCAVAPYGDSLGSRSVTAWSRVEGSDRQGEAERPFSHEIPALEASAHCSPLVVRIRTFHRTNDFTAVLMASPELPNEFHVSPPQSNSARTFVLRI